MTEHGGGWTTFEEFVVATEGRVRRALTPVAGRDPARQATVDGLVHVWQHWDRVAAMANPAGYLYTVARSRLRPEGSGDDPLPDDLSLIDDRGEPTVEPRLLSVLAALPERQRTAVYLRHGCGWTTPEVADLLGVSISTVRNHTERGLRRLRRDLEVDVDDR